MKLKEYDFTNLIKSLNEKNSRFILFDRFTNVNGMKLGIFASKPRSFDHGNQSLISFGALPKYYPDTIRDIPQFSFEFGYTLTYGAIHNINEAQEMEFLIRYGLFEFRKWLNEIIDYKSENNKLLLSMGEEHIFPEIINGRIIQPRDPNEDARLEKIAEDNILRIFRDNAERGPIDIRFLKDICFVPLDNFNTVYNYLIGSKYINLENGSLTPEGYAYYKNNTQETAVQNINSHTVFVAQAFNEEMNKNYSEIIYPLIKDEFSLTPIIISNEDPDVPVDVEILNQINLCKFMICDLTFARPSVYFEAGYAIAKGIKVLFSCRVDHNSDNLNFDSTKFKVHFDLRNRQITWWENGNKEQFKEELKNRIKNFIELQKQTLNQY